MTRYVDSEHGGMEEKASGNSLYLPLQPVCPKRDKTISPLLNTVAQGKTEPKI